MNASVEIIFDNSSKRFPFDHDELSLKRTIGFKKDEYFLDNRHVNKKDVESLLVRHVRICFAQADVQFKIGKFKCVTNKDDSFPSVRAHTRTHIPCFVLTHPQNIQ